MAQDIKYQLQQRSNSELMDIMEEFFARGIYRQFAMAALLQDGKFSAREWFIDTIMEYVRPSELMESGWINANEED